MENETQSPVRPEVNCVRGPLTFGEVQATQPVPPPPDAPKQKAEDIHIIPLDKGFKVMVGCQSMAIQTQGLLIHLLDQYLKDPGEITRQYYKGTLL